MNEDGIWRTLSDGRKVFIKNKDTNDYMNNFIRNKGKNKDANFIDKKTYDKMIDDFYNSLNEEEKEAIELWVSDPGFIYNKKYGGFVTEKDFGKVFENIFAKKSIELQQDTLLFRRDRNSSEEYKNGYKSDGYISTSAYDKLPTTMPSGIKFGSNDLYIVAPKGTKILPIEKVAVNARINNEKDKRIYTRQHEIILNKNTNLKLLSSEIIDGKEKNVVLIK